MLTLAAEFTEVLNTGSLTSFFCIRNIFKYAEMDSFPTDTYLGYPYATGPHPLIPKHTANSSRRIFLCPTPIRRILRRSTSPKIYLAIIKRIMISMVNNHLISGIHNFSMKQNGPPDAASTVGVNIIPGTQNAPLKITELFKIIVINFCKSPLRQWYKFHMPQKINPIGCSGSGVKRDPPIGRKEKRHFPERMYVIKLFLMGQ